VIGERLTHGCLWIGHNDFSHMARVALLALGHNPVDLDGPIYDYAKDSEGFYESIVTAEQRTAEWARGL